MEILLLFSLLPRRCGRQIVEATSSIVLQIVIRQILQIRTLNPQILQCPCIFVDSLVETFLLDLVRADARDVPPNEAVEVISKRLEEAFGEVDVSALMQDLAVYEGGDFGHAVVDRAVEFKGFRDSSVIHGDFVEGFTYIDGLENQSKKREARREMGVRT